MNSRGPPPPARGRFPPSGRGGRFYPPSRGGRINDDSFSGRFEGGRGFYRGRSETGGRGSDSFGRGGGRFNNSGRSYEGRGARPPYNEDVNPPSRTLPPSSGRVMGSYSSLGRGITTNNAPNLRFDDQNRFDNEINNNPPPAGRVAMGSYSALAGPPPPPSSSINHPPRSNAYVDMMEEDTSMTVNNNPPPTPRGSYSALADSVVIDNNPLPRPSYASMMNMEPQQPSSHKRPRDYDGPNTINGGYNDPGRDYMENNNRGPIPPSREYDRNIMDGPPPRGGDWDNRGLPQDGLPRERDWDNRGPPQDGPPRERDWDNRGLPQDGPPPRGGDWDNRGLPQDGPPRERDWDNRGLPQDGPPPRGGDWDNRGGPPHPPPPMEYNSYDNDRLMQEDQFGRMARPPSSTSSRGGFRGGFVARGGRVGSIGVGGPPRFRDRYNENDMVEPSQSHYNHLEEPSFIRRDSGGRIMDETGHAPPTAFHRHPSSSSFDRNNEKRQQESQQHQPVESYPEIIPRTPSPEPAPPSSFTTAFMRMVEMNADMEYAAVKLKLLEMEEKRVGVRLDALAEIHRVEE